MLSGIFLGKIPSVRTIASDCGVSERTIQRTMKVFIEEGGVIKKFILNRAKF